MICSNFFRGFISSCGFLRLDFQLLAASCGWIFNFLRLLAVRLSTSCVSNVLVGKPQKKDIFASCGGLRVLAAQELLAPLLARALFLGCTVPPNEIAEGHLLCVKESYKHRGIMNAVHFV